MAKAKRVEYIVTVHPTSDRKSLKGGVKVYEYGVVNIRAPELKQFVGKRVKVTITESSS